MNYVDAMLDRIWEEYPRLDKGLAELYALLALVKGRETSLEDVHDAWSVWRHRTLPNHRSLVPFDELASDVQELDRPYMEAIHRAAAVDVKVGAE